jgi:hypothetical protein
MECGLNCCGLHSALEYEYEFEFRPSGGRIRAFLGSRYGQTLYLNAAVHYKIDLTGMLARMPIWSLISSIVLITQFF